MKCLIFQVTIAVDDRPIAWSQSEEGSRTEAYGLQLFPLFPWHHPREVVLAGTPCTKRMPIISPLGRRRRANPCPRKEVSSRSIFANSGLVWNIFFFARLDMFRCFRDNFHGRAFIHAQFNFTLHMICVDRNLHRKAVYDETIVHTQRPALWEGAHCVCGWAAFSGTAAARNRRMENSYCDTVLAGLTGVEVICKRSAKRKTGTTATYPAESKRKQRLRWATASQDQAQRRKVDTKARKQALAATNGPNPA